MAMTEPDYGWDPAPVGTLEEPGPLLDTDGGHAVGGVVYPRREWADQEEATEATPPTVLLSSRDEAPPDVPDVPGVARTVKLAQAAGWETETTYASALVHSTARKPEHTRNTVMVRIKRTTTTSGGQVVAEAGYVSYAQEQRTGEPEPGKWGFAEARIDGEEFGARQLGVRLGDKPEIVLARRERLEEKRTAAAASLGIPRGAAPALPGAAAWPLNAERPELPAQPGTWGAVHQGDTLRGADGADYVVSHIEHTGAWISSDVKEVRVTLDRSGGEPITLSRPTNAPVTIAAIADHSAEAAAIDALTSQMFAVKILEEGPALQPSALSVLAAEELARMQAAGLQPAQAAEMAQTLCVHPQEALSTLNSGVVRCTACGLDIGSWVQSSNGQPIFTPFPPAAPLEPMPATIAQAALVEVTTTPAPPTAVTQVREPAPPGADVDSNEFGDPAPARKFRDDRAKYADPDGVEHVGNGRYLLPHPLTGETITWARASTIAKELSSTWGLQQWGEAMTAKGIALRPDLAKLAAVSDYDDPEGKAQLRRVVKDAKQVAGASIGANSGTALHEAIKARVAGRSQKLPADLERDVQGAMAELAAHHVEINPALSERVVVIEHLGIAGRCDLFGFRGGRFKVVDYKTSKPDSLEYSWDEWAIQEFIYASATHMFDPVTWSWVDLATIGVDQEEGIILHAPVGHGKAVAYGLELAAGKRKLAQTMDVRVEKNRHAKSWLLAPVGDKADQLRLLVSKAANQDALADLWDRGQREGTWTPEVELAAADRWDELAAAGAL